MNKMSDYISREDAINAIGKAMPQLTTPDGCGEFDHEIQIADEAFVDCMEIISNLPSVQQEHGEWEYHSNPYVGINLEDAYCSCCGFHVNTTEDIDFDEYNFCPRCGVKMTGA